jgi:hypothetical protein
MQQPSLQQPSRKVQSQPFGQNCSGIFEWMASFRAAAHFAQATSLRYNRAVTHYERRSAFWPLRAEYKSPEQKNSTGCVVHNYQTQYLCIKHMLVHLSFYLVRQHRYSSAWPQTGKLLRLKIYFGETDKRERATARVLISYLYPSLSLSIYIYTWTTAVQ